MKFHIVSPSCEAGHPLVYRLLSTDPTETGMRPTFKRLEVKDLGNLEKLVAENIEGIEPGLRVIDSRLVLGQAAIDLVALDARESLVLVALDFLADEGLLLRAMDAYSWCLEYPDALRRLYPMANVLPTRPPRILFIVERLTDAFVRRIKHLSFLEIDCLEFRHLEVNGASAVYFDLVERLRRGAPVEPAADARMITAPPMRTPKRTEPEPPVVEPASRVVAEPKVAQPPRPPAVRETASAIPERMVSLEMRLAELLAEASAPQTASPAEMASAGRMSFAVEMPSLGTLPSLETPSAAEPSAPVAVEEMPAVEAVVAAVEKAAPAVEDAVPAVEEAVPTAVEPMAPTLPAWAKPSANRVAQPIGGRTYFFSQAAKGTTAADAQAAAPAPASAYLRPAAPAQPAVWPPAPPATQTAVPASEPGAATTPKPTELVADRPELEALHFPKDGLSRQWLEFLNQLGGAK